MENESIAKIKTLYEQFQQGVTATGNKIQSPAQKANEWVGFDLDLLEELKQSVASALKKLPKDAELLKLSAHIYYYIGEPGLLFGVLDKWKKVDKKSSLPYLYRAEYFFQDEIISYDVFLSEIKDALKIDPDFIPTLLMAYLGAEAKDDYGRQLKYSCEVASRSQLADWHFVYGMRCRQGMMSERAEREFKTGLAIDPDHPYCIGGLAQCYLESGNLDKAEELFASLVESKIADVNEIAKSKLKLIENIKHNKPVPKNVKRLLKYGNEWAKRRMDEISEEQHKKLIAECFVGK